MSATNQQIINNEWEIPEGSQTVRIISVVTKVDGLKRWTVVTVSPVDGPYTSHRACDYFFHTGFKDDPTKSDVSREQELVQSCLGPLATGSAGPHLNGKVVVVTTRRRWRKKSDTWESIITSYECP